MSNREIIVENLTKTYPPAINAVDGISFQVGAGEIFGFLGPNGAGKSTAVKILTTLALPTAGTARVGGFDVVREARQVRGIAGVALQEIGLDPLMKPLEMLIMQGRLFGFNRQQARERAQDLLVLVGLEDAVNRRVGTYSGGMRRRLDLAMALIHQPEILFLDEPTTGLDPAARRDIWREVRRLNRELGITIFLTTQYLEEADMLADRIAIINQGKLVAKGSPQELKASLGSESINISFADRATAERARPVLDELADRAQVDHDMVRLYLGQAANQLPAVANRLQEAGFNPASMTITQPTLDDVFLKVTGQRLEVDETTRQAA